MFISTIHTKIKRENLLGQPGPDAVIRAGCNYANNNNNRERVGYVRTTVVVRESKHARVGIRILCYFYYYNNKYTHTHTHTYDGR